MAQRSPDQTVNEIISALQGAMRRIRHLEESVRRVEAKQESTENNFFRRTEDVKKEMEDVQTSLKDLNTKILKLENEVSNIKKVMNKMATKAELKELESYMDLLSPLRTHYVTEKDVREIVAEMREEATE